MNKKPFYFFCKLIAFATLFTCLYSNALVQPRSLDTDGKVKVITYNGLEVIDFKGFYGYQTTLEFNSPDEEVETIAMGDTQAWQIIPSKHRILIKPIEENAETNMTVITNKNTYLFTLKAYETNDIMDPDLAFYIKILHKDNIQDDIINVYSNAKSELDKDNDDKTILTAPDLKHPEKYNFNYTITGHDEIAPIKIFDDGEFIYLQFRDFSSQMPAIFAVDDSLQESMVNYKTLPENNMVVVDYLFPKLSVRLGKKIVCIFNEAYENTQKAKYAPIKALR